MVSRRSGPAYTLVNGVAMPVINPWGMYDSCPLQIRYRWLTNQTIGALTLALSHFVGEGSMIESKSI